MATARHKAEWQRTARICYVVASVQGSKIPEIKYDPTYEAPRGQSLRWADIKKMFPK
jgi:hypothetical protein